MRGFDARLLSQWTACLRRGDFGARRRLPKNPGSVGCVGSRGVGLASDYLAINRLRTSKHRSGRMTPLGGRQPLVFSQPIGWPHRPPIKQLSLTNRPRPAGWHPPS